MPLDKNNPLDWLRLADMDRQTANILLVESDPPFIRNGCFHIEQCVEKTLKGLLVARGVEPPRIHDIGKLILMLDSDPFLTRNFEALDDTTYYAVQARYGEFDLPDVQTVRTHLAAADELFAWAQEKIAA